MNGCFLHETKQIVVNVETANFKKTFYHEVGHALTYKDTELMKLCEETDLFKSYKRIHPNAVYELMADLYARYILNPKYLKRFPKIYNHFSK